MLKHEFEQELLKLFKLENQIVLGITINITAGENITADVKIGIKQDDDVFPRLAELFKKFEMKEILPVRAESPLGERVD